METGLPTHSSSSYTGFRDSLEGIKRAAPNGAEIWKGREILPLLEYADWDNFDSVVRKAIHACESTNRKPEHHFREVTEMIVAGKGAKRERADWLLSRVACYLIAMNADPAKPAVGYAQAYFAVQTRRQEIGDEQHRLRVRLRVIDAHKNLNSTAKRAGVERFPLFHDAGYRGLYGGRGLAEIKRYKQLDETEELLDRAGRAELAANEFRITQTDQKIIKEDIKGENGLIAAHRSVGQEVRGLMDRTGGVMPEDLPLEPSIRALLSQHRKALRAAANPDHG